MNKPIIIPCGHTICSICIEKIIKSDSLNDSLNSESNSNSNNVSSDSFLRIQSFEEDLNSNFEDSNEEEEEDDDDDENVNLEEEEEEDDDEEEVEMSSLNENSEVLSIQRSSEMSHRENIESNNNLNNIHSNRVERSKKDNLQKMIKIRCSICRVKSKTQRKNLIINNDILDLIKSLLEGDTVTEGKDNIVFCIECNNHFKENIHKHDYPNHELNSFHINFFIDIVKEFNKNEKKISNVHFPLSKKVMIKFIDKIKKINIKIEQFMKEFSPFYNIFYMINYLETKLFKIYGKYQVAHRENNFISLCNVETVVTKFFQKMYIPTIIKENFMKSTEVYSDFSEIVKNSLFYKISSITQNNIKTDRKYLIAVGDDKVYIFDARTKYSFEIKFSKIFENFDSKKRKQQKKNYELEKNFTEYVEISENGRYIMMIGKSEGDSKKFRVYDIFENKIIKKPNMSVKLSSVDMFYYDRKLLVLGGLNQEGYVRSCEYYDFDTEKWNPLPSLNIPRELKSILVINDYLVVYFGNNDDNNVDINTFESLNLRDLKSENLTWESFKIKNFSQEFSYNGLNSVLNENIFFIFGGVTKDYEDPIESGYVIDFNSKEIIQEIKLDKKCNYISTNICSTYGNTVCWIDSEELEELAEFDLTALKIK